MKSNNQKKQLIMDRYHVIKRMRKLLEKISHYLQGSDMSDAEIKNVVTELESLLRISQGRGYRVLVPDSILSRVNLFLEAFKHHIGIEKSNDPDVMGIEDLKAFLSKELGIKANHTAFFHPRKHLSPIHTLFI